MKKYTYILMAVVVAGSTLGALAEAESEKGCPRGGKRGDNQAEIFKQLDADGDGQISAAEFKAGHEAMKKKRGEHGKGPHGKKGKGGKGPRGKMCPEVREKMLKKFDADGDGKLSEAELAEARKACKEKCRKGKKSAAE